MHSAWFSRDSTGIVSFLRARRSGRTQKRFEKDNNSVDAFFKLVLGYIEWKIVSQSGQSACYKCWYASFRFPVNLCWRPCWIFQRINLASAKFDARSTSNNDHIPRKTDFDADFSNFPVKLLLASVLNFLVHQNTTSLRGYIFATCHIERQFSERTHCALDLSG